MCNYRIISSCHTLRASDVLSRRLCRLIPSESLRPLVFSRLSVEKSFWILLRLLPTKLSSRRRFVSDCVGIAVVKLDWKLPDHNPEKPSLLLRRKIQSKVDYELCATMSSVLGKIKSQKLNAICSEPNIADSLRNGLQ